MKEIWKPITELDCLYEISNYGRVKRLSREVNSSAQKRGYRIIKKSIVKPCDNGKGYKAIMPQINHKRKVFYIHRLVASYFIENPKNFKEVNHKDLDKSNNHVNNLEWCDRRANHDHFLLNTKRKVRNKSGFIGVYRQDSKSEAYLFSVRFNNNLHIKGGFKTLKDAAIARNEYIIKNNLPNRLNEI
jgi:hypothetical protein